MKYFNAKNIMLLMLTCALTACGGGGGSSGGGGGATDSGDGSGSGSGSGNGNGDGDGSGDGGNSSLDTDGDGLTDAEENQYGTNPAVHDTDGDGFSDKEEVDNWDRDGGNHLRFNPLVADVPRVYMRQMGTPVIQLYANTEESGTVSKGMSNANSAEVEVTTSRGRTNTHKVEEQHTVGVNAEVSRRGPITSGSVSANYEYQHNDTTTDTSYWDETKVATNRQESSEYYETINSETVITKGGEIKVLMGLANDGDVSYSINNMELAAYMKDPANPGNLISVGTLRHDGPLSFTPDPLGPQSDLDSNQLTPFNFVYAADNNPEEISRILEGSNQLVLQPTNLSITGQRSDVDLNLAAQNIRARTAEVIIDFGDHNNLPTERYRVAIDTADNEVLSFETLMQEHLNFGYQFDGFSLGGSGSHTGLNQLRGVSVNEATNSYWLLLHTFTPPGSPSGTRDSNLYNILSESYTAADVNLRKGDVLHLVYITDTDLDGLSDRMEQLNGTNLNQADTDGDGLDDALETYGWYSNLTSAPCDQGESLVLVRANPLAVDSDDDGINDSEEYANCSNPMGELQVDLGDNLLTDRARSVSLRAVVDNAVDTGALRYHWTQLTGVSVGQLPNSPQVTFTAPQSVTTLEFQVEVTDTSQNDIVANDRVRVSVVKDATAAWFVDPDSGHDFNNNGSPDAPVRTLARALELVTAQGGDIYLNTPEDGASYLSDDTLVIPANVSVFGGFDDNWWHNPAEAPTPILVDEIMGMVQQGSTETVWFSGISVATMAPVGGNTPSVALHLSNANSVVLDRMKAQGADLTIAPDLLTSGSGDYVAGSSYGVLANNVVMLDIQGSELMAGRGADGARGLGGSTGATGARGGNADGISGGGRGNGNGNGQAGGSGASATGGVVVCTGGSNGSGGSSAGSVSGGGGGRGGSASYQFPIGCEWSGAGNGGTVYSRAATGSAGSAASELSGFDANGWLVPRHGSTGGKGAGGAGGGGGGSGNGIDGNNGGGGGGGGEGGDGGSGGRGARGAGGSFALVLVDVDYTQIADSRLVSADGGLGGLGGWGGTGGDGGQGGNGYDSDGRAGGDGGRGGPGGNGGQGGGGSGGPSAALVLLGSSAADVLDSVLETGNAGSGRTPNRGIGGWNYGIYTAESAELLSQDNNSFSLGVSGNSAPDAAPVGP